MEILTQRSDGFIHLISSIAALTSGTFVLFNTKGTSLHKKLGYGYVISMVVLNVTAFVIYRLFGRFGPFHIAAIIPALYLRHKKSWIIFHFTFMYWSVIGLYAAFVSEVIVRLPRAHFWWSIAGATAMVIAAGAFFFIRLSKKWEAQFFGKR